MTQFFGVMLAAAITTASVLKSVLPSVYIGLFLANVCHIGNWQDKGLKFAPAVMKITGLSRESALSVLLAIGDRTAGMAALAMARGQSGLSDKEVIAANLIAKAPSVAQFFVFSFIPVMFSLFPQAVAQRFLTVYFLAFTAVSAVGILSAKLVNRTGYAVVSPAQIRDATGISWYQAVRQASSRTWRPFFTAAVWMSGMSFAVMFFIKAGMLYGLKSSELLLARGIEANILPVIAAGLVSMLGGVAATGAAFEEGLITAETIVPLLLSISLLHNCYDFVTSSIPRAVAVFGRRLGLKTAAWSFAVTQIAVAAVTAAVFYRWL